MFEINDKESKNIKENDMNKEYEEKMENIKSAHENVENPEAKNQKQNQKSNIGAKIRVIGVGGGGGNAINTMIKAGLSGVEYIVANTDAQALEASLADVKIQLGNEITKGLGAGANPEVGRKSALEEYERLSEHLIGADMVFVTAGMGGGTGTGAAPVIAKLAKELGALTVGVVTKPFLFEGKKRYKQAESGIQNLEESVDSLITIPNQRLLYLAGENLSLIETFKKADEVLLNAVQGISDLINNTGLINADFADVSTVMANKGLALMGTGVGIGPDRAVVAAKMAISSPLLEDITIDGATGIIINITGGPSLTTFETNEAVTLIMEAADENAEIIFGTVIDENLEDEVKVTVVATGLGHNRRMEEKNRMAVNNVTPSVQVRTTPTPTPIPIHAPIHTEEVPMSKIEIPQVVQSVSPVVPMATQVKIEETKEVKEAAVVREGEAAQAGPTSGRAKTIAERLGFLNFEDDEFETPTFLRKDKDKDPRNKEGRTDSIN